MTIHETMAEVTRRVEAIGKNKRNKEQQFDYRGIDDVYAEINRHFKELGIFCPPEVLDIQRESYTTKSGGVKLCSIIKVKYTFFAPDGTSLDCIVMGEGMDVGDKSINKAMSAAHKYALCQMFCIPAGDLKDPDADSHGDIERGRGGGALPGRAKADQLARIDVLLLEQGLKSEGERLARINKWLSSGNGRPVEHPRQLTPEFADALIVAIERSAAAKASLAAQAAPASPPAAQEKPAPSQPTPPAGQGRAQSDKPSQRAAARGRAKPAPKAKPSTPKKD